MYDMKIYITHGGIFHADEVLGWAILRLAHESGSFERRTNLDNLPTDGSAFIADIGRECDPYRLRFDHHQGFFTRNNKYPLATAGMIWQEWGTWAVTQCLGNSDRPYDEDEITTAIAARVDEVFIQGIDAHDADSAYKVQAECSAGAVRAMTISHVIASMNGDDPKDAFEQDRRFRAAADFMLDVLQSQIRSAAKFIEAKLRFGQIAQVAYHPRVIVLPEFLPWQEIVCADYPDALYVITPSGHPGNPYSLTAVPVEPGSRELKKPIERPEWFGGFIHQGKWIAGGDSIETLLKLAEYNIERHD